VRSTKAAVYTAPAIAARIVEFANNGDIPPYCVVENIDALASAAIRYQESDDGSNWTDIPNTVATVNPGTINAQVVTTTRSRIALHAGGNVKVTFTVERHVNGAPNNLGVA
jgi:hypothetical protein